MMYREKVCRRILMAQPVSLIVFFWGGVSVGLFYLPARQETELLATDARGYKEFKNGD